MEAPKTPLHRLVLVATMATTLALGACGGSGKDEQAVRKRVTGFYAGLAGKDPARVCDSLAGGIKRALTRTPSGGPGPRSCEAAMRLNFLISGNQFANARKAKVLDVQVKGDRAAATVSFQGRKRRLGLSKQDGDWLITTLRLNKP